MRDIVLLLIIGAGALAALRRPWIGALVWTWVSIMSPHAQFGYAASAWPVGMAVGVCTLIGFVLTPDKQNPFVDKPVWWMLAFTVWICITLPFSFYFDGSFNLWLRSMKIFLMVFVTIALLNERRKIDAFIWVTVLSLGYYGVKGGVFTLATGGNYRVWGPGGFIEGNNEIALALVATIPLMRYLHLQLVVRWQRHAMMGAMLLTAVTVLGTYSRGALLALSSMAFFLWLKGKNKIVFGVLTVAVGVAALSFMPEAWWSRMETIKTYEKDDSALGRINAWWNAWNLAKSNPFGGGFMIYTKDVFARYAPEPDRVHAAHSIYFQVLGEHGFIGLFLFLAIGASTWMSCRKLIRMASRNPELRWAGELGSMVQVGMIGYATGGAFLSLAYFDLPYNMMVAAVAVLKVVTTLVERAAKQQAPLAMPT